MEAENKKEVKPLLEIPSRTKVGRSALVSFFLLFSNFTGQLCLEAVLSIPWRTQPAGISLPAIQSRGEQESESNRHMDGSEKEGETQG